MIRLHKIKVKVKIIPNQVDRNKRNVSQDETAFSNWDRGDMFRVNIKSKSEEEYRCM